MAVCDVCNQSVDVGVGYLLTTTQVVSEPGYWEHAFRNQWSYYGAADPDGGSLALTVRQQVGQSTPWVICEKCISNFTKVDKILTRSYCQKWWASGQKFSPPGTGQGSLRGALAAAAIGWEKTFGKYPSGLGESIPLAASLHTFDQMGLKPTIAATSINRPSPTSENEKEKLKPPIDQVKQKKPWWQFWKA